MSKNKTFKKLGILSLASLLTLSLTACSSGTANTNTTSTQVSTVKTTSTSTSSINVSDYFTDRDLAGTYDESNATKISLNGSSASVNGSGATFENSVVKIKDEGIYIISGNGENIQIYVEAADSAKVQIVLNNVNLTNKDAAFVVQEADKVFLTLAEGTTNSIQDSASNTTNSGNSAIFSRSDLVINGKGTLNVTGNYENAIESNDDLRIANATLNINAKKHALSANDAINSINATLNLTSKEDAIHSDNEEDTSLGNIYLRDNNITINAGDDGIHGTNNLIVDGGNIDIKSSVEGIEGRIVKFESGTVNIKSTDDGINATNGTTNAVMQAQSGTEIIFNNGTVYVNASGDGIDSNGNVTVNGGEIYVNVPSNTDNGFFDYDGTGTINGGKFLLVGSTGMFKGFSNSSTQATVSSNVQGSAGAKIVVKDSSGNELLSYTSQQAFNTILATHPDIKEGEQYTISVNGTETKVTASKTVQASGGMKGGRSRG